MECLIQWKCFEKKNTFRGILFFSFLAKLSEYHCTICVITSNMFQDKLRGLFVETFSCSICRKIHTGFSTQVESAFCQIVPRAVVHTLPFPFCLCKKFPVPFGGKFSPVFLYKWKARFVLPYAQGLRMQ